MNVRIVFHKNRKHKATLHRITCTVKIADSMVVDGGCIVCSLRISQATERFYMYTGDSWPVNSLNIDVGIVFIKI